jgi:2-hydroxycyclohexanecarboxyl-CoA dehydrogenase
MTRTALVTGAASGIGRACALRLAKEGMAVGVLDLTLDGAEKVAAEIKAAGGKAVALQADVSKREDVTAAVAELKAAFGPALVLVNNAGIVDFRPFEDVKDADWDQMFAVNVKAPYMFVQTMLADMRAAKWGRVIIISSSGAQTGAPTAVPYTTSKAAIFGMVRSLALELGSQGITVNNVPPAAIRDTGIWKANMVKFPIPVDVLAKTTPVGRLGEPEDIANAVAWLASEATSYVTGQTIGVNGGRYLT